MNRSIMATKDRGVSINGLFYDIRYTPEDNKRRCAYFRDISLDKTRFEDCTDNSGIVGKPELSDEEKRLLENLKINLSFQQNHAYEMYLFFKELPNCQTTTAMSLSAGCSTANYIIFSVLMEAQIKSKEEFEKKKKNPISTDLTMMFDRLISGASGMVKTTPRPSPETAEEAVKRMANIKAVDEKNQYIIDIFTIDV
jgi:hypothetical protein